MREIKFRAWDEDNKRFFFWDGLENAQFVPKDCSGDYATWNSALLSGTVEQFTGLHDKNGKEIYEGDIVSAVLGTQGCGAINRKERSFNFVINWWKNGFEWSRISPHDRYRFYPGFDKCEVIGNIHENQELLK